MKTLKQLTVGDMLYVCHKENVKYYSHVIRTVEKEKIRYGSGYDDVIERVDGTVYSMGKMRFYANEPDAIRFAKSQMMKELFRVIEAAKKGIQIVKDFREENFELLNHEWTDQQINKLEKELAY